MLIQKLKTQNFTVVHDTIENDFHVCITRNDKQVVIESFKNFGLAVNHTNFIEQLLSMQKVA